jgi:hypothetical protein
VYSWCCSVRLHAPQRLCSRCLAPRRLCSPLMAHNSPTANPFTAVLTGTFSDGAVLELALDPSFARVVQMFTYARRWCGQVGLTCASHDGVEQISLQLGAYDALTPGDYYWHASAGPTGEFSPTFKFTIVSR